MAFHPYPQLIRAVFNPQRFGPPRAVTLASTWPWIDRHGFGSSPTYQRPIQTRFRFGSGPEGLNLHVRTDSPDHNAKGTPSDVTTAEAAAHPPTACRHTVSGSFHSPPGVLFTFPSRYWCTIGHERVFSLGPWSGRIHAGFHVSSITWDTARPPAEFRIQGYHLLRQSFPTHSAILRHTTSRSRNPSHRSVRFRLFPVRSPLLGESMSFSLPWDTEMFHFSQCRLLRL